jgi:type II secretory pathway pseudopilin PulG
MRKLPSPGRTGRQRGWGRFQIESAIMALIFLIPVLISLTVPIFTRSRMYGRETAAIQAIRTIHTAEIQYQSQFGRYAASLTELGPPASGAPNALAAGLIGNDLANSEKAGYKFTVAAVPGGYVINAVPASYGISGSRSFYSDQTMVVRENYGPEPATAQSKELR